uniref:Uncharacterized protein n=1 Tax=Schistosoma haematobium TaxID=6185 RepID=A0A094ZCV7_SCHHA
MGYVFLSCLVFCLCLLLRVPISCLFPLHLIYNSTRLSTFLSLCCTHYTPCVNLKQYKYLYKL